MGNNKMSFIVIPRSVILSAIRRGVPLRRGLAAAKAWLAAQSDLDRSLTADLTRHQRDVHTLATLGMTRGEVNRMIDRTHR
jgi:hypothetical protein